VVDLLPSDELETVLSWAAESMWDCCVLANRTDLLRLLKAGRAGLVVLNVAAEGGHDFRPALAMTSSTGVPALCIVDRCREVDPKAVLAAGASDCLMRPLGGVDFRRRVALLTGAGRSGFIGAVVACGPVGLDLTGRTALVYGQTLELGRGEFDLLAYLAQNPCRTVTWSEILTQVMGGTGFEVLAARRLLESLRSKLVPFGCADLVTTAAGLGGRLDPGAAPIDPPTRVAVVRPRRPA